MSIRKISAFLPMMFLVGFFGHTAPGGSAKLYTCVANACPDEPISMTELASQKAGELIDSFYKKRHKYDGFNGCVMVARDGKPIYCGGFGYANYATKDTLTPH